jgi:2-dehydropantoate 2-reductase
MNFLIVGPGAMGCLFAARLKKAGHDVILLDYLPERADAIQKQGIRVKGITGEYTADVPVVVGGIPSQPDYVLICVKAYQTKDACTTLHPWLPSNASVITLQNGVGNLEILKQVFGEQRIYGGVTAEGATLLGYGQIRHAGQGDTIIGPKRGSQRILETLVSAFQEAGFNAKPADNVDDLIWGKLIINVGINALTAITGLKNGRLPQLGGTHAIMEKAVQEAVSVAQAKGIHLPYPDPLSRVVDVCHHTAGNIASMLQDVLSQKTTEIDFINGAIVREGERMGIPTPVNKTLFLLVQTIHETYPERVSRFAGSH